MAARGAQPGNVNAAKPKRWASAIDRALQKRGTAKLDALDKIAEQLLALAEAGDMQALKELGDRLDGKSVQSIDATVDANVTVEIVRFGAIVGSPGTAPSVNSSYGIVKSGK